MARQPRVHVPGGVYHVILRGNDGQDIFHDNGDRYRLASYLDEGRVRFGYRIAAFCFMSNHLHLAIQVADVPLSRIMQSLAVRYTWWVNTRQKRCGHLFQGRYRAILVDDDAYLLGLVRYIHLNPVRAGLVDSPGDWHWSGHNTYLGDGFFQWVSERWVLARFSHDLRNARRRYLAFVEGSDVVPNASGTYEQGRVLGSELFFERQTMATDEERLPGPVPVDDLVDSVCTVFGLSRAQVHSRSRNRKFAEARAAMGWLAVEAHAGSLSELARRLGRDVSTLSGAATRLERRRAEDPLLRARLAQLRAKLR